MNIIKPEPGPWTREFDDFARAFSGAFVFGVPLPCTMEMWWIGTYAGTWRLLLSLALALAPGSGALPASAGRSRDGLPRSSAGTMLSHI